MARTLILLLMASLAFGQSSTLRNPNYGANRIAGGAALPATCTAGGLYYKTAAPKGVYQCVDGTWRQFFAEDASGNLAIGTTVLTPTAISPGPMVTFSFDDGLASAYTTVFPIFQNRKLGATFYVISSYDEPVNLSAAQMVEMETAGMEIGSHTITHVDLTGLSAAELRRELRDSQHYLRTKGVQVVDTTAYPMGLENAAVRTETALYYRIGRLAGGDDNPFPLASSYLVNGQGPIVDFSNTNWAANKALIDTAIAQRSWLIFIGHDIDEAKATGLARLVDYAVSLGVPVLTVRQALLRMGVPLQADVETANMLLASEAIDDTNYWSKRHATLEITADQAAPPEGVTGQAELVHSPTEYNTGFYQVVNLPITGTFTFSCYIKATAGTPAYALEFADDLGSTITSEAITASTTWTRYSVTSTFAGTERHLKRAVVNGVSPGEDLHVAGCMVNSGATAAAYVAGAYQQ